MMGEFVFVECVIIMFMRVREIEKIIFRMDKFDKFIDASNID